MKTNIYNKTITIKNSYLANQKSTKSNYLKKDQKLLKFLMKNGFINSFDFCDKRTARINLNFDKFLNPAISTLEFIPKNWKKKKNDLNTNFRGSVA